MRPINFLYFRVSISPDSLLGGLLLVLLLEHGELVGEILLTDPHGITPQVCILVNRQQIWIQ